MLLKSKTFPLLLEVILIWPSPEKLCPFYFGHTIFVWKMKLSPFILFFFVMTYEYSPILCFKNQTFNYHLVPWLFYCFGNKHVFALCVFSRLILTKPTTGQCPNILLCLSIVYMVKVHCNARGVEEEPRE